MNKQEYIQEMKNRGWDDEAIREELEFMQEQKDAGLNVNYEMFLLETPVLD